MGSGRHLVLTALDNGRVPAQAPTGRSSLGCSGGSPRRVRRVGVGAAQAALRLLYGVRDALSESGRTSCRPWSPCSSEEDDLLCLQHRAALRIDRRREPDLILLDPEEGLAGEEPLDECAAFSGLQSAGSKPGHVLSTAGPAKSSQERTNARLREMALSLVFVILVALTVDEPTGFDPKLTVPGVTLRTFAALAAAGTAARRARRERQRRGISRTASSDCEQVRATAACGHRKSRKANRPGERRLGRSARTRSARQQSPLPAQVPARRRRSTARAGALEPPASVVVSRRCLRRLGVLQKCGSIGLPVWRRASRWVLRFIGAWHEGVGPPRLPVLSSEHESTIVSSPISPTSSAPCRVARCSMGRNSPFLSPKGFPRRTSIVICAPPWIGGRCNTLGFEPRSGTEAPTSAVVARLLGRRPG